MPASRHAASHPTTILVKALPPIAKTLETWGLGNRDVYRVNYLDSRDAGYFSGED